MYAEVIILVASNPAMIRRLSISTCFILQLFKMITLKWEALNDVLLFSMKYDNVENNKKR